MSVGAFYASDNPEYFLIGPHKTEQDAIDEFKLENDGKHPEYIGMANEVFLKIDADLLLDDIRERMYDELYEDAMDNWCTSFKASDPKIVELSEKLTGVLHEWLDSVGEKKSFDVITQVKP